MSQRRTAVDREREGAITGVLGLVVAAVGFASTLPALIVIGALFALIGAIMWGAGMAARRD